MPHRSRDPRSRGHRAQRRRRCRRPGCHPGGTRTRQAGRPGQQGIARDGRPTRDRGGGARWGRVGSGRQRAQRDTPVHRRPSSGGGETTHHHGVGRTLSSVEQPAAGECHARRRPAAPDLAHGAQDHGRQRDAGQQGARGHRGTLPLRTALRPYRGGRPPPERGAFVRRVRGRERTGPTGRSEHGASGPLRAVIPGSVGGHRGTSLRPGRAVAPYIREGSNARLSRAGARYRCWAGRRRRARRVQRGKRAGGRPLPGRHHPVRRHFTRDRERPGTPVERTGRIPRSHSRRRRHGAAPRAGALRMLALVAPIIVFGLVIFVHELGHFVAAKLMGVYAPRFSIGFGPSLIKKRVGETEYVLAAFPLGGYVRMASREDEATAFLEGGSENSATTPGNPKDGFDPNAMIPFGPKPIPESRWFESKSLPARLFIMLAGVFMNALLAYVIYAGLLLRSGLPSPVPVAAVVSPGKPAALAGIRAGDSIASL